MLNKISSRTLLIPALLAVLSACSSTGKQAQNTQNDQLAQSAVSQAQKVALAKTTAPSVTAKLEKSGLAKPILNHGNVVGYKYKRSFAIPALKNSHFGFSYTATQENSSPSVSRLPVTVKVTHPPMKQANGSTSTESSWQDSLYFGRPNHSIWKFESEDELVEGKWTISVLSQGNVLIEKNFFVKKMRPMPGKITTLCQIDESLYPAPLAKAHQACCTQDDAQACYNFAWRGVERLKDLKGAVMYYGRGCDLGDASACRAAGQKAKDEAEKQKWFEKGCELKDIDSCLEIGKTPY